MGKGIIEGPILREEELMLERKLQTHSSDYLRGYLDSYRENRGRIRKTLEDRYIINEPLIVRAHRRAFIVRAHRGSTSDNA